MDASQSHRAIGAIHSQVNSAWHVCLVGKVVLNPNRWFVLKWRNLFLGVALEVKTSNLGDNNYIIIKNAE